MLLKNAVCPKPQEKIYVKSRARSSRPLSAGPSFLPVPVKAVLDPELSPADLRVLAHLYFVSRRRKKQGKTDVTISYAKISEMAGLSQMQAYRSMARLKNKGFLTKREGSEGNIGSYLLNVEKPLVYIPTPVFELSPSALRVYALLRWRQGRNDYAYPRVRTIAADLGLARCSVQRALRELEAAGWIKTEGKQSHAYRVALAMPFPVEKAIPCATAATNFPPPSAEMAMPSQESSQGGLTNLQHSPPSPKGTVITNSLPDEIPAVNAVRNEATGDKMASPNAEATMATRDLPQAPLTDLQHPSSSESPPLQKRGPLFHQNKAPPSTEMIHNSPLSESGEMQTGTEQASSEHLAGTRSINTSRRTSNEGDGQGESDFQLGDKANFDFQSLGGEEKPSNTGPLPQDSSPSAGKAHASPSPRSFSLTGAFELTYDAKSYAALLRGELAKEERELAALRKELERAPAERRQELEWKIDELENRVKQRRQRLAEVEGKLGTGLLAGPDDLPATME